MKPNSRKLLLKKNAAKQASIAARKAPMKKQFPTKKMSPVMANAKKNVTTAVGVVAMAVAALGTPAVLTSCDNGNSGPTFYQNPALNGGQQGITLTAQGSFTRDEINAIQNQINTAIAGINFADFAGYIAGWVYTRTPQAGGRTIIISGEGADARATILSNNIDNILADLQAGKTEAEEAQNPGPTEVAYRESATGGRVITFYKDPSLPEGYVAIIAANVAGIGQLGINSTSHNVSMWIRMPNGTGLNFELGEDGKAIIFSDNHGDIMGDLTQVLDGFCHVGTLNVSHKRAVSATLI